MRHIAGMLSIATVALAATAHRGEAADVREHNGQFPILTAEHELFRRLRELFD